MEYSGVAAAAGGCVVCVVCCGRCDDAAAMSFFEEQGRGVCAWLSVGAGAYVLEAITGIRTHAEDAVPVCLLPSSPLRVQQLLLKLQQQSGC